MVLRGGIGEDSEKARDSIRGDNDDPLMISGGDQWVNGGSNEG